MKIEDQVPSRELSEKLKELGYPQKGLWWHIDNEDEESFVDRYEECDTLEGRPPICIAPTVAEMKLVVREFLGFGYLLESGLQSNHNTAYCSFAKAESITCQCSGGCRCFANKNYEHGNTEAIAIARMLIYLAENKLITFK